MGNAASSLPFSIGSQVLASVNHGWVLHKGTRNSDGAPVSVFVAKKPSLNRTPIDPSRSQLTQLVPALHHFHQSKKLRHPHILQIYATLDTDHPNEAAGPPTSTTAASSSSAATKASSTEAGDLIIVTEPCITLDAWLQSHPPPEQIAWGLECIVRALDFLHSAKLVHGAVCPESFYVTPAGDVKLWNFSICTPILANDRLANHFTDWEALVAPGPYRAPERLEQRWDAVVAAGPHGMDSYSLGVLIGYIFDPHIPGPLQKAVQRLLSPNIKRPRVQPLLRCPVFDTPYQKLQLQLEEFAVQPVEAKISFWQNVTPNLQAGIIPQQVAVYKLLPMMKTSVETVCGSDTMKAQDMYRREVLATMQPLFFVAENYLVDGETIKRELTNVISLLFQMNDRGIRGNLLQKASFLADHLDKAMLNQAVFEPTCSGFSDSSAALRELTLKATLLLVPYLTQPNLEKLSRYLVRLQGDTEASIRTNTVIFFSKLAPYLTDMSRQKLLLPAFMRAMKDPFTPCRLAALQSVLKCKEFFDPAGIASKVLPAVTPQLLDPSKEVRKEAFAVVDDLLFALRQESERLNAVPEDSVSSAAPARTQPNPPVTTTAQAPSSGGYLSGMSSWLTSSAKPTSAATAAPTASLPIAAPRSAPAPAPLPPQFRAGAATATTAMANLDVNDGWDDDDGIGEDDGWGDDNDELNLNMSSGGLKTKVGAGSSLLAPVESEDEFFGSFDSKQTKPTMLSMGSGRGKLATPTTVTPLKSAVAKPAVTKLALDDDDGWDDF